MSRYYPLLLGWRFFRTGTGNRLVSFVSLLAVAGLILGVALMIVVMSVMNGFDREMRTRILGLVPHIQLVAEGGIDDWQNLREELLARPEVSSVEPFVRVAGLLNYHGRVKGVELLGIDETAAGSYARLGNLKERVETSDGKSNILLISEKIANELQVPVGAQITLLAPRSNTGQGSATPAMKVFTVAGFFNSRTTLDNTLAITTLGTAASVAGIAPAADGSLVPQGLQLGVEDVFLARSIAYELLDLLPPGFGFVDWIQTHGNLYQAIQMSRKMVGLLVFAVIAVAVFNVVAMLVMTVVEKQPAIAILKTQGASRRGILATFLVQGSLIGLVGVSVGSLLGVLGSLWIDNLVALIERLFEFQFLNVEIYPIDYIPADVCIQDVVLVIAVALGLNLLATLYPAWKAAMVLPGQVLRYE